MPTQTKRPATRLFAHVADPQVRRVLETPRADHINQLDLSIAVQRTALHIARDSDDQGVPAQAVERRATSYIRAELAAGKGDRKAALAALRACWNDEAPSPARVQANQGPLQ